MATTNNLLNQFEQLLADHKADEKELQEAEKKYRSIFDNALEGIYQTTPDGRFISANPFLAKVLGYETPEQLIEEITDIGSQLYVDRAKRDEILHLLLRDGHVRSYETQFYRKDGTILWGSQSASIVRNEAGEFLYIEGTVSDITATKQAAHLRTLFHHKGTWQRNGPRSTASSPAIPARSPVTRNLASAQHSRYSCWSCLLS